MNLQTIKTEIISDKIGLITLNRPEKRNALSIQMRLEISMCLNEWENSEEINIIIFTGEGKTFSAGFDLKEFGQPKIFEELFKSSSNYHRDIWNFPKPVIAAVNGPAMAGGLDLITLCDIRICSENAVFGHPEIKFGAPPLFTPLRWIIGNGFARDLCLTGRKIDAADACRMGLVSEIINPDKLLESAINIAKSIIEAPLETLQYTKKFFIENTGYGFEESFKIEHDKAFLDLISKIK